MKRRTWLIGFSLVIALGSAGTAWRARFAANESAGMSAELAAKRQPLLAEAARLRGQQTSADKEQRDLRAQLGDTAASHGGSVAANAPPRILRSSPSPRDPPAAQVRAMDLLKSELPAKYGAFYREAGLSAEQVATFGRLLVEHDGRMRDIRAAEADIKIDKATAGTREAITFDGRRVQVYEDKSIGALRDAERARLRAEQVALLGEAGYERLQAFEHGAESRAFVAEVVGNLVLSDIPLTLDQGQRLTVLLQRAGFRTRIEPELNDWPAMVAGARAVLTPAQFAEFEAQLTALRHEITGRTELSRLVAAWRQKMAE